MIDIEETHGLECMITEPTRIQTRAGRTTKTLIDVILTNEAQLFAREQVRAQGINPMEFMARPLREAGRRGGVGPIVVPPYTPPSSIPSSYLDT